MILKLKSFYESKNFIFYVLGIASISFLINFMFNQFLIVAYPYIAFTISTFYSILVFLALFLYKDTKYALTFVFFYPFMHATFMKIDFNTLMSFLPTVIMVIGVIVHHVKYNTKLKMTKLLPGAIIYFIGIAFGGIGSLSTSEFRANYIFAYTLAILFVSALIVYVMLVITSDNKATFKDFALVITYTGVYICIEVIVFWIIYLCKGNNDYFDGKVLSLGWGGPNTIGTQLLMFIPCPMYLVIKEKKKLLYMTISYLFVFIPVMSFSRGTIIVLGLFLPFALFFTIKYSNQRKKIILYHSIYLSSMVLIALLFFLISEEIFYKIADQLLDLRVDTFNNRKFIYESLFRIWDKNKAFGVGLIASFSWNVDFPQGYQFAHNTFLQMLFVSGIFGLICITIHITDKYLKLLVKPSFEKIMVFFMFLLPGLYGLFDVTYLNTVYLITLFASYCMFNDIFKNDDSRFYVYY